MLGLFLCAIVACVAEALRAPMLRARPAQSVVALECTGLRRIGCKAPLLCVPTFNDEGAGGVDVTDGLQEVTTSIESFKEHDSFLSEVKASIPKNDKLDKKILALALPAIANFAILPLVGAVDTAFVGRMDNALALAGQSAANQVFSSTFWIISFLPSVISPLIAAAVGSGDKDEVQNKVGQSIFLALVLGIIGSSTLVKWPHKALKLVLPGANHPAMEFALPYLKIRAITFLPALLTTVYFAVLRASMDLVTPLKISLLSNFVNVVLDPIFIFKYDMGVAGAAVATCIAEVFAFALYTRTMVKRDLIRAAKVLKMPSLKQLEPILVGGVGVQIRAIALNIAFLAVTRATQALDATGTAAAAHAVTIQLWQLGGVVLLAWSSVAAVLVPGELAKAKADGLVGAAGVRPAKVASQRMLGWGLVLGVVLSALQLLCLPLLSIFTPLQDVQQAARLPSVIGAALQLINGVVFIGEGICQGCQSFGFLAGATAVATTGMLSSLHLFGDSLAGVWGSFAVFNGLRLLGVLRHQFVVGPFSGKNMQKHDDTRSRPEDGQLVVL